VATNLGQLKGAAYASTLAFIDERFGKDGRARVLSRLSPADREVVSGLILPIGWYPLPPFPRLLRAMDQELGHGDGTLITERGTWAGLRDMKTTYKLLLKFASPQWVLEKGTSLWKNFHDTGRWETARHDLGARATLIDHAIVDAAMCATLKGWIIGLLTICNCKQPKVLHDHCRVNGAEHCVYDCSWSA
jgi:hypothetical protein